MVYCVCCCENYISCDVEVHWWTCSLNVRLTQKNSVSLLTATHYEATHTTNLVKHVKHHSNTGWRGKRAKISFKYNCREHSSITFTGINPYWQLGLIHSGNVIIHWYLAETSFYSIAITALFCCILQLYYSIQYLCYRSYIQHLNDT